jgi:phage terminase small subunit
MGYGAAMRRGSKPKPTALKKLAGTLQPCRMPSGPEPVAPGPILAPPSHLSARQREIWQQTLADAPRNLWRAADTGMLTGYVIGLALLETANLEQQKVDAGNLSPLLVIGYRDTAYPSPYLRIIRFAAEMVARFGAELGMSPSSRSSLAADVVTAPPGRNWSSFDALLKKAANRG